MEEKNKQEKDKKPTYEELNNYCLQLAEQNRRLREQAEQLNMTNLFRRLDYLFAVVREKEVFGDEFTSKCAEEIKQALTIPEKKEEKGE